MIQNDLKSTHFALNMTDNLAKKQIRKEQARLRQFETEFNNDFSIPVDIGKILTMKWPQKRPLMTFLKYVPNKTNSDSLPDYETACQMIASDKKTAKNPTVNHNHDSLPV